MARNYDFRKEMHEFHRRDIMDRTYVPGEGMLGIDNRFAILIPERQDLVLQTAALDLQNYLFVSLNVSVAVKRTAQWTDIPENVIAVGTCDDYGCAWEGESVPASYRIVTEKNRVLICGIDSRGCAQGCYQIEDQMNRVCAPYLNQGVVTYSPEFSPRMIHSGFQMDFFPDSHLSAIAHAGMDAVLMFVKDVNMTPTCHVDFNDLIYRAGKYGLDVYAYSYYTSEVHPDDPGAVAHYEQSYGKLFKECPGLKGVVLVGESVEFPSKDSHVSDLKWYNNKIDGIPTYKPTAGWYPCCDYDKWLKMLQKVIGQYKPDADIVFWTYNWCHASKEERMALIDSLPEGISLMVTFEMGDYREVDGLRMKSADYTLSFTGPSPYFVSEAERAKERDIRLYSQANSGGLTWDFGVIPYEPFPMQWAKRYNAMLECKEKYGLCGIMESHHFGYWPSFISKIEKLMFTAPRTKDQDAIRMIARELYGPALTERAMEAFTVISEAIHYYVCSNEDQYGPFRIGPAYPLVFRADVSIPTVPYAHFGGNAICFTDYASDALFAITDNYGEVKTLMVQQRLPKEIQCLEKMRSLLRQGGAMLNALTPELTGWRQKDNLRLINMLSFMEHTVTTVIHVKEWNQRRWQIRSEENSEKLLNLFDEMIDIAHREIKNTRQTIPLVEADSRLGWEPSMEYNCDVYHLEWKIRQVTQVIEKELPKYMRGIRYVAELEQ